VSTSNIPKIDTASRKDGQRKTKVLIVDDEPAIREVLEMILQEWGYEVRLASDGVEAKDLVESYDPEIVISDVVMPQLSGLDLLRCLKAGNSNRPVILVTAHASIDLAVESMKQGAQDFITKPMDYPKLRAILKAAESDIEMRQTSRKLTSQLERGSGFGEFVGSSKVMHEPAKNSRPGPSTGLAREPLAHSSQSMPQRSPRPLSRAKSSDMKKGRSPGP